MNDNPVELVTYNTDETISTVKFGRRIPKGSVVIGTVDANECCWIMSGEDCDEYQLERLRAFQAQFLSGCAARTNVGLGPDPEILVALLATTQWVREDVDGIITNFGMLLDLAHPFIINHIFDAHRDEMKAMSLRWIATEMAMRPYSNFYAPAAVIGFVAATAGHLLRLDAEFENGNINNYSESAHTICEQLATSAIYTSKTMRTLLNAMAAVDAVDGEALVKLVAHINQPQPAL